MWHLQLQSFLTPPECLAWESRGGWYTSTWTKQSIESGWNQWPTRGYTSTAQHSTTELLEGQAHYTHLPQSAVHRQKYKPEDKTQGHRSYDQLQMDKEEWLKHVVRIGIIITLYSISTHYVPAVRHQEYLAQNDSKSSLHRNKRWGRTFSTTQYEQGNLSIQTI